MTEQFSEKASRLLDRINSITFQQKNDKLSQTPINILNKAQFGKPNQAKTHSHSFNPYNNQSNNIVLSSLPVSPQTQTLMELGRIQQDLSQNQEENCRKLKNLNQDIRKMEVFVKQENQMRVKIHQNFINSVIKAEKNMHAAIANIRKTYAQREKKLQMKIDQVLKSQKRQLVQQLQQNSNIEQSITKLKVTLQSLREELQTMKRTRLELEDKISRQFNDQITDLKAVFNNSIKIREERQLKILETLKAVYKKYMESVRKQQSQRQSNQKMFLTVIEQLIDRITEA